MEKNRNVRAVARAAITEWGSSASEVAAARAAAHREAGDAEGHAFWLNVETTILELSAEGNAGYVAQSTPTPGDVQKSRQFTDWIDRSRDSE